MSYKLPTVPEVQKTRSLPLPAAHVLKQNQEMLFTGRMHAHGLTARFRQRTGTWREVPREKLKQCVSRVYPQGWM